MTWETLGVAELISAFLGAFLWAIVCPSQLEVYLLLQMKKGNTMQQFLQKALEILRKDFSELRSAGVEQLMYIKEDLIIPHHHSFYDFIVTKARGKSGPLFNFDVHDDVRLLSDATVEKDESHAGKVVLRSWYEKNKHIFPASRWEPYDPEKKWDKYTVRQAVRSGPGKALLSGPGAGLRVGVILVLSDPAIILL